MSKSKKGLLPSEKAYNPASVTEEEALFVLKNPGMSATELARLMHRNPNAIRSVRQGVTMAARAAGKRLLEERETGRRVVEQELAEVQGVTPPAPTGPSAEGLAKMLEAQARAERDRQEGKQLPDPMGGKWDGMADEEIAKAKGISVAQVGMLRRFGGL